MGTLLTALIVAAVFALFYATAHCFIKALESDVSRENRDRYRVAACLLFAFDMMGSLLLILYSMA